MGVDGTGWWRRENRPEGVWAPPECGLGLGSCSRTGLRTGAESSALPPLPREGAEEGGAESYSSVPSLPLRRWRPVAGAPPQCGFSEPKGPMAMWEQGPVSVHVHTNRCVLKLCTPLAILPQRFLGA